MITEKEVLALADNMAAAASQLSAMTYDNLMESRTQLQVCVHELFEKIKEATDHRKV
jgi:hypothetical protein